MPRQGHEQDSDRKMHPAAAPGASGVGVIDPVCGMAVDPHTAHHHSWRDRTYYFCSAGCRGRFAADPAKYLGSKADPAAAAAVPAGAIYTCPMHPEIRRVGPGHCPICGMALEPVLAAAETGPDPELIDLRRRFWVGLLLAIRWWRSRWAAT